MAARSVDALRAALTAAVNAPETLRQMAMTNLTTALELYRTAVFQRAVSGVIDRVANQ